MKILNQKGLTLIEILAAVVILMIVIIGFLGFFSQAISHSRITEDKLTAINLAEKIIAEIKQSPTEIEGRELREIEDVEDENGQIYYALIDKTTTNSDLKLQIIYVEIYSKEPNQLNEQPITELYSYYDLGER